MLNPMHVIVSYLSPETLFFTIVLRLAGKHAVSVLSITYKSLKFV